MEGSTNSITNDYTEIVRRLPCKLKISYGVGHVLNDICASMWFTYLLVFFHLVLGFSAILSGIILLIGQIADALATPFVGLHSDKNDDFWLCRYGRRKTWHLLGTVCILVSFPFIFSPCINCEGSHQWAQVIYYSGFVIIFQFGWAAVQISHLSLIPDLTPTEHERTELTAIRYSFTVFANVLVYCIIWGVLHVTSGTADSQIGPKDVHHFQTVVLIGLFVGTITSLIFHFGVKEGPLCDTTGPLRRNTRSAGTLLKDIQLYQVAGVYMPTRLFVNLSQVYVPLYLHESLNMAATSLATIPLTMFISSFAASLVIEKLNTNLGRKIAYAIGVILGIGACLWIRLGSGETYVTYEIYPVSMLLGTGGSIMLVTSLGVTADLIGQSTESGAFVYGVMSFTDKLSNGLVVGVIQSMCTTHCPGYYRDVLTFACGGAALFGLLMLILIKPFKHDQDCRTLSEPEVIDPETIED
ncbi:major facilitator superfamily domain-containing protein 12-like [Athalia rosae]|uniref:major facilitator superfamily domain-containing protein 12-like n=1 Tax=Athalia rosae TaxID=37344 RepID=UPI00203460FE|nr:major facilitator superfamily domain-containing protein 12-like [Athalia rosae]XP_012251531.2 major facilitator superfamily domain-containing protein 12-like [Athalia rosae]